ncbi:MAG: LuxR C-terminal-related transcriptional regulator [Caulobacterales bacterium]
MDDGAFDDLIERVYDMALEPELWPGLLERLTVLFGGHAGSLVEENMESGRGGGLTLGLDSEVPQLYFGYYASRNVLRRIENPRERMVGFRPVITVDEESMPKSELARTEFYNDFLRPAGIHSVMTIGLWGRGVDFGGLDVYRPRGRASFSSVDRELASVLHPHLIRAFRLSGKLAETRQLNAGFAEALDQSPYGLMLLDEAGKIRHANTVASRMLADPGAGLKVFGGRLTATTPDDARRLGALIAGAGAADQPRVGGSMAVRRPSERAPLSVVVAPLSADRVAMFHRGPAVVVCVTDPEAASSVSETFLRDLFGLTAGQAKVAGALMDGQSPRQAAEALGLSFNTVRAHLAQIFAKTGVNRQAELVALMTRAGGLGGR